MPCAALGAARRHPRARIEPNSGGRSCLWPCRGSIREESFARIHFRHRQRSAFEPLILAVHGSNYTYMCDISIRSESIPWRSSLYGGGAAEPGLTWFSLSCHLRGSRAITSSENVAHAAGCQFYTRSIATHSSMSRAGRPRRLRDPWPRASSPCRLTGRESAQSGSTLECRRP